jgi:DNA-binding transcriptional LysR family regulator
VDRALAARGLSRTVALRVPHFSAAPLAVLETDWICTLAASFAARAAQLFGVRVLPVPLRLPATPVVILTPARAASDPASRWLRAFFTQRLSGRGASSRGRRARAQR